MKIKKDTSLLLDGWEVFNRRALIEHITNRIAWFRKNLISYENDQEYAKMKIRTNDIIIELETLQEQVWLGIFQDENEIEEIFSLNRKLSKKGYYKSSSHVCIKNR
jgi:hypothetical protein